MKRVLTIAMAVAMIAVLAAPTLAQAPAKPAAKPVEKPAAGGPVNIGAYLPMTGGVAAYGQMEWDGVKTANEMMPKVLGRMSNSSWWIRRATRSRRQTPLIA